MLNAVPAVCGLLIVANAKWSTVVLATTVNVIGLPVPAVSAPPEPVPDAVIVTDPAVVPVTVSDATPATAFTEPSHYTLPPPTFVFAKLTLNVLSGPVVIVLPTLS